MSLPAEIRKKVKLLELSTRKRMDSRFLGDYHSAFRGQGMTFSEFREYVPGDDIRAISWPVTARTGKTYIKKFDEERELTLVVAVDISGSVEFGSQTYLKGEVMAHLAALLGFSASSSNDPVGLLLFTDQVEHYVPPKKGRGHILRLLRDLYYFKPRARGTAFAPALQYLQTVLRKRAHIFLVSDFLATDFEQPLRQVGRKHDVVAVVVQDPLERAFPAIGLVEIEDPETGETLLVDAASLAFQKGYAHHVNRLKMERDEKMKKLRVDRVDITVGEDFVDPLVSFFKKRSRG